MEKGFDFIFVLPSDKRIRTFGKFGLSPPSSVKSFCAAAFRALSMKVRSPRAIDIPAMKSCAALLLYSVSSAKVVRTFGFLLNVITPTCVLFGPMCNASMSSMTKPLSSKRFGTPRLLVLSITNATSIPLDFSQGSGAAGNKQNYEELAVACTLAPGFFTGISLMGLYADSPASCRF